MHDKSTKPDRSTEYLVAFIVVVMVGALLAVSYGIEVMRARIWANEMRNAGCSPTTETPWRNP